MAPKTKMIQEEAQFAFMETTIDNAFQCRNTEFYKDTTEMVNRAAIFALIMKAIKDADADFVDPLNIEDPELDEMWISCGEGGLFISHFTYKMQDKSDAPPFIKSTVLIGRFELNAQSVIDRVAPFYYLHGVIEVPDDKVGEKIFFPLETGCRTRLKGHKEDSFSFAEDTDEVVQMLCYGREAFELILTKQLLSVANLGRWLDVQHIEQTTVAYDTLVTMTPSEFAEMIKWKKAEAALPATSFFISSSTPTRN